MNRSQFHDKQVRVAYIGAGNPVEPQSGMDVVVRSHIIELASSAMISLSGVFVTQISDLKSQSLGGVIGFSADPKASNIKKMVRLLSGKLHMNVGFASNCAKRAINLELAKKPDILIIDHIQALSNVSVLRVVFSRSRLIYIAHNVTPDTLLDAARLRRSWFSSFLLRIEAFQAWVIEVILQIRAEKTVFISHSDEERYRWIPGVRAVSLCPIIGRTTSTEGRPPQCSVDTPKPDRGGYRRILFIGSPGFQPNRKAIDWIVAKLVPALHAMSAPVTISFIGGGTREYVGQHSDIIESLGFVDECSMQHLLSECVCLLSPVVHGSGLKIKVLEAFAAGVPVLATPLSLQGFGFMDVDALINLDRPVEAAKLIFELVESPSKIDAMRAHVRARWKLHINRRSGALVKIVLSVTAEDTEKRSEG